MKKIVTILLVLIIVTGAILAYVYYQAPRSQEEPLVTDDAQLDTDQNTDWQVYTNAAYRYGLKYPPGFAVEYDPNAPDPDADVALVNRSITKKGQAAFLFFDMPPNDANGLSLQEWWDVQVEEGSVSVESSETLNRNRIIGGRNVIVSTPPDLGSTAYYFLENDRVILLHGFLVEPYIDQVIESFKIEVN